MKKILTILTIMSFIFCIKEVNAISIESENYNITIEKITLDIYNADGSESSCENEDGTIKLYCNEIKSIDLTSELTIDEKIKNDIWYLNKLVNIKLIDLNINTENILNKYKNNINLENAQNYAGILNVHYKYESVPTNIKSIYQYNTMEYLLNIFSAMSSGKEYKLPKQDVGTTLTQPIYFVGKKDGDFIEYDSVKKVTEIAEDDLMIFLNYDVMSELDNDITEEQDLNNLIYIHNLNDVDTMKDVLKKMYAPTLKEKSKTNNSVTISVSPTTDSSNSCKLYKSTTKDGTYSEIATITCDDEYIDNSLNSNTTYYYKVIDNNDIESDILVITTLNDIINDEYQEEDDEQDEENNYKDDVDEDSVNKNNSNVNEETNKNTGTVDSPKTGISSLTFIFIIIIVSSLIVLIFNKNIMKTKI